MKQTYRLIRNDVTEQLTIQEYTETDSKTPLLLCTETYELENLKIASRKKKETLIESLRSTNIYPPGSYMKLIADTVIDMLNTEDHRSAEISFDDKEITMENNAPNKNTEATDLNSKKTSVDITTLLEKDLKEEVNSQTPISIQPGQNDLVNKK